MHGVEVELRVDCGEPAGTAPLTFEILRIAHEALHNAVRHAAPGPGRRAPAR